MSITFNKFNWHTIQCIEDPIYPFPIDKEIFFTIYNKLLETLDGRDLSSFIDFFFERSSVNNKILVFVDENAKEDFKLLAEELELTPSLIEICEGESEHDKLSRSQNEIKNQLKFITTDSCNDQKKDVTKHNNNNIEIIKRSKNTIITLTEKINIETDIDTIKKINEKIIRTTKLIHELEII